MAGYPLNYKRAKWSEEDEARFEVEYRNGGIAACLIAFPDRTPSGVKNKACMLGLLTHPEHSHKKADDAPDGVDGWPVPDFQLGPEDIALREWGYITSAGELKPIIGLKVAA